MIKCNNQLNMNKEKDNFDKVRKALNSVGLVCMAIALIIFGCFMLPIGILLWLIGIGLIGKVAQRYSNE